MSNSQYHYPYYRSTSQLPLGSLPHNDYHAAAGTIQMLLESARAQLVLSRIIAGPEMEPSLSGWQTSLVEPPKPPQEFISIYLEELQGFVLESMPVDSKTLQQYQSGDHEGCYKRYRLLEIACTAIHFLAVRLYQKYHPQPPLEDPTADPYSQKPYPEIRHQKYFFYKPSGDMKAVGFWVEAQIFGGVILFDRGLSGDECKSVWLHGRTREYGKEVYQLPDDAVSGLLGQKYLPLELVWEELPHRSLAAAQQEGIYREFNLARIREYHNFLTVCQRSRRNSGFAEDIELLEKKIQEALNK
ncbi:hypothetical protein TWF694_005240 [Orbilia ellipsospora]|uniref:Uncharacterized protein n=1 Tax=Orbilia ellipsospora TaxID=2528407 RepID=A0AAV9WTV8_9PEZI